MRVRHPMQLANNDVNLESLRSDLVSQIAILLIISSGFIAWLLLIVEPFPWLLGTFWVFHAFLGILILKLRAEHPLRARMILLAICNLSVLIAMVLFSETWIPFVSMPLILVNAILINRGEWLTTALALASIFILSELQYRDYPTIVMYIAMISALALSVIVRQALHRTIDWTWMLGLKSIDLLEIARDRQGELNRTVKALRAANEKLLRMQTALVRAQREAEAAKRAKEQFAANISHELRTPLNIIVGFSEVLFFSPRVYGKSDWPPALRTDIAHIYHNSYHLANMINDVLDLSRLNKSEFSLSLEGCFAGELLNSAITILEETFVSRNITIYTDIAPAMPELTVDMTRIRQVLINLLTNAINFSDIGSSIFIQIKYDDFIEAFVFSIRDEGIGIAQKDHQHIFEEFYQIDSKLSKKHQGAGLGLAISKQLVEAHNGKIWVESDLGQGANFYFTIPTKKNYELASTSPKPLNKPVISKSNSTEKSPIVLVYDATDDIVDRLRNKNDKIDFVHITNTQNWEDHCENYQPQAIVFNANCHEPIATQALVDIPLIEYKLFDNKWSEKFLSVQKCLNKPITSVELESALAEIGYVKRVVIIDDNRGFCQLVERMLQTFKQSFEVKHAYDPNRGLHLIKTFQPDVIILDLIIEQDSDGFELINTLQNTSELSEIPIIVISAFTFDEAITEQHENRIVATFPGNTNPYEIFDLLSEIVGKSVK